MITHCPSCNTHFRVYAEQLAARAGQVRCGKCSRVFNALEHLIEETAPAPAPGLPDAFESRTHRTCRRSGAGVGKRGGRRGRGGIGRNPGAGTGGSVTQPALRGSAKVQAEVAPGAQAFDFGPAAPARRWPWLLGALLLLLTLLAQTAYHYRGAFTLLFRKPSPTRSRCARPWVANCHCRGASTW